MEPDTRTGPRETVTIRVAPAGADLIRQRAEVAKVKRSEYLRALLAEALRSPAVETATANRLRSAL